MEPFIGQIIMFGGNFAPQDWALCDGTLLPIASYQALFSILGTTYGGDGRTTFALPDLRGRVSVHPGSGPGLTTRHLGEKGGAETVALTQNQMPSHTHMASCVQAQGNTNDPTGGYPAVARDNSADDFSTTGTPNQHMASSFVNATGGDQAHQNMEPFLCVNYLIALVGTYPSRS